MSVKSKIRGLRGLRLVELDASDIKEIWVINETKPKGVIALEVKDSSDGSPTAVTIPPTWVPICLTDQVPKKMLINAPKFRTIVSGGHIKVLDPKQIAEILQDQEVAEEINAIRDKSSDIFKETLPEEVKANSVSVIILDLLSREATNSIKEVEAVDILNNREDELVDEDIEYLLKNSTLSKVKRWATETLADRNN